MELVGSLHAHAAPRRDWPDDADWQPAYDAEDELADEDSGFDEYFEDDAIQRRRKRAAKKTQTRTVVTGNPLVTAAELAGSSAPAGACPPESFRQGMVVTHPELRRGQDPGPGRHGCQTVCDRAVRGRTYATPFSSGLQSVAARSWVSGRGCHDEMNACDRMNIGRNDFGILSCFRHSSFVIDHPDC